MELKQTRRKVIAMGGVGIGAALAGCTGSADDDDGEYQGGGDDDDDNGNENEDDLPDEEEVEDRDEGEDYLEFGDLSITEHDLVVEEDEFLDEVYVEGVVENGDDDMFDYVEVSVRVYDADGHQLDRYMTNTQDLDPDQTWAFEVTIMEDAEDVDDFDIAVSGSQH
ncbi:hypothetical protein SAMN04487967_1028 [Natronorubrum sediminis]|uniref:Uncharacterized protein n=1 Tax=Natronorubrum sediminis TaxID=640943 RepID=A0A1H6FPS5_9EURY|nr:FxLYD domain-containing protein [Natronorubrum sediminis]SEH12919.1 hypothetical protein SAMN04487967_1028 [Natronorubrum sediminis]